MAVAGLVIAGILVWYARHVPNRVPGGALRIVEIVLVIDAMASFLVGIFTVWLVLGLLAAVAALWQLHAHEAAPLPG